MRNSLKAAALAVLIAAGATSAVAAQQSNKAAATPKKPTPEEAANMHRAAEILRGFTVALQTKDVPEPVKVRLVSCLYNNKLSAISEAAGKALKADSSLSEDKPVDVYRASAGVCGVAFKKNEGEAAPAPESR